MSTGARTRWLDPGALQALRSQLERSRSRSSISCERHFEDTLGEEVHAPLITAFVVLPGLLCSPLWHLVPLPISC